MRRVLGLKQLRVPPTYHFGRKALPTAELQVNAGSLFGPSVNSRSNTGRGGVIHLLLASSARCIYRHDVSQLGCSQWSTKRWSIFTASTRDEHRL